MRLLEPLPAHPKRDLSRVGDGELNCRAPIVFSPTNHKSISDRWEAGSCERLFACERRSKQNVISATEEVAGNFCDVAVAQIHGGIIMRGDPRD
jgi:hypothetical protein